MTVAVKAIAHVQLQRTKYTHWSSPEAAIRRLQLDTIRATHREGYAVSHKYSSLKSSTWVMKYKLRSYFSYFFLFKLFKCTSGGRRQDLCFRETCLESESLFRGDTELSTWWESNSRYRLSCFWSSCLSERWVYLVFILSPNWPPHKVPLKTSYVLAWKNPFF